jgi:probable rRNA maturation factor
MIKIYIKISKKSLKINKKRLKLLATEVIKSESKGERDYEIGVTLVGNTYMRSLNKRYRNIDSPTDVLAFPIEIENKLLGDIYISIDKAYQQLQSTETIETEISRLLIHGLLHLLGYEHSEQMFTKQEKYLHNFAKVSTKFLS